MGLLSRLFANPPTLAAADAVRLQRLSERAPPGTRQRHDQVRYVTVDVETTGLDLRRDRVVSIGAVAVVGRQVALDHCFEVVVRQDHSSTADNILIHRIGGQRQMGGADPQRALLSFLEFVGHCPLVAYRAEFDRTMLDRALKDYLGTVTQSHWIDLAEILPALYPSNENKTMDDWLDFMNIRMLSRHDALADALATAQMLQVCLVRADALDMVCPAHLLEMQKAQHWLGKR